ncbi:MAG TPA: pyridoxal phosphate-dependent aminotransferase [Ignavibacteriales bacterium]|nr:pyridoxal phosphate-dependent aminotransferase [Ignavibacteriales bacterium]HPD67108.1 pyridoxal phosphate-dependent aminotransferase [Ignavibacteriales bacterium]HRR19566.1 pyridoxal phosphate-dependent aminotransferase [Ignavibacteriales bacterium]
MKYSDVVSSITESRTLQVTSLIKKLKAEGHNVITFSAGEPDFPTPDFICKAGIEAIQKGITKYTNAEGSPELIKAICNKFEKENNIKYEPNEIVVSSGAKHSIYNALVAICNPRDEVIIQSPYWVSYPEMIKLVSAKPVIIETSIETNFKITPEQLQKAITNKTKAILLNSPSNPSGAVYTEEEQRAFANVVKDKDIIIITDEIYEKLIYDGAKHFSIASIPEIRDKVVTINGMSKAFSMTGWRIGYLGTNKELAKLIKNYQSHAVSHPSTISMAASVAALEMDPQIIENMRVAFENRRNFIMEKLSEIEGIKLFKPTGAFYLFLDVSAFYGREYNGQKITDSTSFCSYILNEGKIGIVPGEAFGNDNCVRMSFAYSNEDLAEGAKRLKEALAKLK